MSQIDCPREPEMVAAVLGGHWHDGLASDAASDAASDSADAADVRGGDRLGELRAHAEACEVCADVAAVAPLLRDDYAAARDLEVPAAGQVWWRAALRARAEAAEAAARPMIWLQGLAGACVSGIGVALLSVAWPAIHSSVAGAAPLLLQPIRDQLPLVVAVGVLLIAAPVAFYVAVTREGGEK